MDPKTRTVLRIDVLHCGHKVAKTCMQQFAFAKLDMQIGKPPPSHLKASQSTKKYPRSRVEAVRGAPYIVIMCL